MELADNVCNSKRRFPEGTPRSELNTISLYIFFVLCVFAGDAFPQTRDELILKGIDYGYHLKFDSSNAIFESLIKQNPKDPTGYFFLAMQEWWRINLNREDESKDESYFRKVDECIKVCEERIDENENDDWAIFLKGGVIGYRGFLYSLRSSWFKAANDGREGLSLIQRSYELNQSNQDAVFGVGLYNYAADYVFESYPFLKTLMFFFPKGDKQLGLQQLRDCAQNGKFSKTEAKFVLAYIHLNYEKNYAEAEKYADTLHKMYPENPVFEKFLGRCYAGMNRWNESMALWTDVIQKVDSNKPGYDNRHMRREASYYLGLTNFRFNNLDEAIKNYESALSLSRELDKGSESAFQVFSALGLGIIYDLKGDRGEAVRYYDMVLEMKDIESSRDSAKRFKERGYR
jgi:tetratricopeptide (TPR) repeat protein